MKQTLIATSCSLALATVLGACGGATSTEPGPVDPINPNPNTLPPQPVVMTVVNYEQALRSAALKLTGNYPTLTEIKTVRDAADDAAKKTAYETLVDDYMGRPTFASQMLDFWRDQFKMGGTINGVMMDYAPSFAASLVVQGKPFNQIVTATTGTCQTLMAGTSTFTTVACPNPQAVGILTDAGVQAQFFSNMAFRRVRWVQETFGCQRFPAEIGGTPQQFAGGTYSSPWPFNSISGLANNPAAKVDFTDNKSLVCANCHSTLNHMAPLFANYSMTGALTAMSQVQVPVPGTPAAQLIDWLPAGETTAWRFGKPAADMAALGAAIAADPVFATCITTRVWNWGMSRPDVVEDQAGFVPPFGADLVTSLTSNNWDVKKLTRQVFTSDSFVRF